MLTNSSWIIPPTSSSLTLTTTPLPTPGPRQTLIKLTAASLNYRDLLTLTHTYPIPQKPHLVPCSDGAGTIHSAGPSSRWAGKEGTKVVLHNSSWMDGDVRNLKGEEVLGGGEWDGTLQGWRVVGDEGVVEMPRGWTGEMGAAVVSAGGTAWAAVRGGLDGELEGKWVLTQGTGGMSCFAIQIAAALGATVISTSSSNAKLEVAKILGAKYTINYSTTPDWDQEVLKITKGKGVDHVIEVGGAKTIMKSLNATRTGGLVSLIGFLSGSESLPPEFIPSVLYGAKIVKGCTAFSREATAELMKFVEANGIKPLIAKTFAFEDAKEAFEELQKQSAVGKIVIKISDD
ncbi:alcohol dehydrogenase zinc-binding domain-containing protein [Corynespora cassiicola Philippines]|uniref:Alcohol dehydrogenase zinc-binding domain-containing protein n=1 Tax=Corynespora cassiicola Philippines TaxID=1448308 RepID=A0A2T2NE22_CORCC|nr:alcohol dehydrogenase zinc-binding domain-containing protein [Corynespora cassiicola Philippines]